MADTESGVLYRDRWIICTPDRLVIRGYYFPIGSKSIPYHRIRGVREAEMGALTGQWRIWGTSNPRYWWHLDPHRPHKHKALFLDLGRAVQPAITPDDPDKVKAIIDSQRA